MFEVVLSASKKFDELVKQLNAQTVIDTEKEKQDVQKIENAIESMHDKELLLKALQTKQNRLKQLENVIQDREQTTNDLLTKITLIFDATILKMQL